MPSNRDSFVFSSDWHLKRCVWSSRSSVVDDTMVAAAQTVDYCIEHGLNLVLGGDNFDEPRPGSFPISFFQRQVGRLIERGLSCFAIDGNHDAAVPSWLELTGAVNVAGAAFEPCANKDVRGFGIGHHYRADLEAGIQSHLAAAAEHGANFLVMHQLLDAHCPKIWNVAARWFARGSPPLVLLGDYHEPMVSHTNEHGVTFYYNGSPCAMDMGEVRDNKLRGLTVVQYDGRFQLHSWPRPTRQFVNVTVDSMEQLHATLSDQLKAKLRELALTVNVFDAPVTLMPVLVITYPYTLTGVAAEVEAFSAGVAHAWLEPTTEADDEADRVAVSGLSAIDRSAVVHGLIDSIIPHSLSAAGNALAHELASNAGTAKSVIEKFVAKELAHAKDEATRASQLSEA